MANPTTAFGWVMPTSTSLVTNLPADFNTFGQAVDNSMQYLLGGTTGQVLSKTSGTNMAFTWVTPTDQTPLTTKGDLFTFTTLDARLGVGTNGYILSANSATATGLEWIAANPGDITGVTAGTGISGGGTSGDVTVTNSMATAMTTKGDLVAATGSGTFSRLAVGSNNQTLVADSTASTGLKWATPASGGGLTVIATGTLSSTSVVVSSIPATYKHLMVSVYAATWDTANDTMGLRYNSVTTNYTKSIYGHNGVTATNEGSVIAGSWSLNDSSQDWLRTGAANHANWTIYDYTNTTGVMNVVGTASYFNQSSAYSKTNLVASNQATAAAITSLTIRLEGARNMTAGTYTVYGVS